MEPKRAQRTSSVLAVGAPRAARAALLALGLLCVALVFGRPSVFADTPLYYGQGQALVRALTGAPAALDPITQADPFAVVKGSAGANTGALLIAGARSPTYGLLLYLGHRLGGLLAVTILQALLAAVAVDLFLARFAAQSPRAGLAGALVVGATSLPFFVGFAMPDVFAGLDLLAAAVLLVGRPARAESILATALLCLGAAVHPTHLLVLILLIPTAPLILRIGFGAPLADFARPVLRLVLAAGAAAALEGAERGVLAQAAGERESAPPFLMARLLEDGPGRLYLQRHCPGGAAPLLCRFRGQPLDDSEAFLWSGRPGQGVMMTLPPADRARLKSEEGAFVRGVLKETPVAAGLAGARNVGRQLLLFATVEPLHSPAEFAAYPFFQRTQLFVRDPRGCTAPGRCSPRLSRAVVNLEETALLLLGLAAAAAGFRPLRAAVPGADAAGARRAFAVLVLGVLLNALVCGALSGAFPRYEARLIWVLPFGGVVLLAQGLAVREPPRRRGPMANGQVLDAALSARSA